MTLVDGWPIKLQLSVHEILIDPDPRGDIKESPDDVFGDPALGIEIHEAIQARLKESVPGYRVEIAMRKTIALEKDEVTIQGRADGLHPDGTFDEIKSTMRPASLIKRLESDPHHPYWLQLACYRWMSEKEIETAIENENKGELADRIMVVDARSMESWTLESRHWTPDLFEAWLESRVAAIIKREGERRAFVRRQKKLAAKLTFPFNEIRAGQQGFMDEIRATCLEKGRLLGQAPTGIGKSLGSLFPALQVALGAGSKVAFLTPKNSQFTVAEKAVEQLSKGAALRSITLGAKAKLCLNDEVNCTPDACPYAKGHYDKVAEKNLLAKLSRRAVLNPRTIKSIAKKHEVCPYALSMQILPRRDILIADYNHAFSPDANLRGKMAGADLEAPRPVVLVDEAHNLPDRARDHWSGSLAVTDAEETRWQRDLEKILKTNGSSQPDLAKLERLSAKMLDAILDATPDDHELARRELELFFAVRRFTGLLSASIEHDNFFVRNPLPGIWEIHCLDAGGFIAQKFDEFSSLIAFSATLKPLDFYRNELGLIQPADKAIEWPSPFDARNQKTVLIPQVSTLWREREHNYAKIAGAIQKIVALRPGHYMAFFPSFSFLDQVSAHLNHAQFEILTQVPGQSLHDTAAMLERFRGPVSGKSLLMLAVQGGTFAEGIDLPGEQLIGAFVVGPGLPAVTPVREKMREYFEKKYGAGFDYAYTYPGMAKSVQAAGRVIRTSSDRGLVVLMDRRFMEAASIAALPSHWIDHVHQARPGDSLAEHISSFWR